MRPRGKSPPQTPAQRQRKCRAIKRGKWHTAPELPPNWRELPEYAALLALPPAEGNPAAALPAPQETPALPAPKSASATAIQKAFSPDAAALALPDADGAGVGAGDGLRLSLPPAVEARLRSLLDRHGAGAGAGKPLTAAERAEAQGLLDIAEFFVVQRLRKRLAA